MRFWRRKQASETVALRAGDSLHGLAALSVRPVMQLPDGEEPPREFRVFSLGVNETEKGPFLWDEVAAAMCMDFWKTRRVDLPMDWEHQALAEPPIQAPAAAWWDPEIRDGELWATNIRWTPDAEEQIRKKEYRYFSPAFTFDAETTRPNRFINVALTNIPAMDAIAPLVAASAATTPKETKEMEELKAELAALKAEMNTLRAQLSAKDTENAELKAKLSAMGDEEKEECRAVGLRFDAPSAERRTAIAALTSVATKLRELTGETTNEAAIAKLTMIKADAAETAQLRARIAESEERAVKAELKAVIDEGVSAGKVPPSEDHEQRKLLMTAVLSMGSGKLTSAGVAWLRSTIAALPKLISGSETVRQDGGKPVLTEQQKRIARLAGGENGLTNRQKYAEKEAAGG